nr:MAG TPA: hypothetical protein [Caudoviricetes sp.]
MESNACESLLSRYLFLTEDAPHIFPTGILFFYIYRLILL